MRASYFFACLAGAFFFSSSPTVTKIWQVRFVIRLPRPLARAWKRLSDMACSTRMIFTFSSSTSAPSLCSALAIADSSTFLMMCAPFFGLKASRLRAFSTGGPRRRRSSRRPGSSSAGSRRRGGLEKLLVRHTVALENASQREFAQLVPHHVFRDVYRDVLLAVVDRDSQPDEVGQDGGAPRPGLDRALVARRARRVDFLHQMVVHEGTLLDRTSHGLALVSFLVPELNDHAASAF